MGRWCGDRSGSPFTRLTGAPHADLGVVTRARPSSVSKIRHELDHDQVTRQRIDVCVLRRMHHHEFARYSLTDFYVGGSDEAIVAREATS
jgi:hypothetical protein